MGRKAYNFFWKDESKEDINTTKFLKLLLKYGYNWYPNPTPNLNLTEIDKKQFLKECSESIECIDEMKASIIIDLIRQQFDEEFSRLQKCSRKDCKTEIPWFFEAYKLFEQSFIPEASSITSTSTSSVAIASDISPSVSTLKIADVSMSATTYPSLTPNMEPFSWTTELSNCEQASIYQEKQLVNPSSTSPKNDYDNEFSLQNMKSQYDIPIIYPVCILPSASLGRLGEGSGFSCSKNKDEYLFDNGIPVNTSSSFRPQISDFSYLPSIDGISDRTNSYHLDNRHSQIIIQDRNSSQPATSENSIQPIATGFTANNSLVKELENFTKFYFQ